MTNNPNGKDVHDTRSTEAAQPDLGEQTVIDNSPYEARGQQIEGPTVAQSTAVSDASRRVNNMPRHHQHPGQSVDSAGNDGMSNDYEGSLTVVDNSLYGARGKETAGLNDAQLATHYEEANPAQAGDVFGRVRPTAVGASGPQSEFDPGDCEGSLTVVDNTLYGARQQ